MARRESKVSTSFLRTFLLVIAGIIALFFVDTSLATMERTEGRVEAERFYQGGQRLMKEGRREPAVEQFRAARAVARDNQGYQLALAEALSAAGQFSEAEATLTDLLQRDATGGAPNLALARVLTKEDRINEANSYYHRAIYGQWKQDARANRVRVRFELIDLLLAKHQKEGLLAELLPLEEEAPDDVATKLKIGRLFIAAGSPARGADVFRDVLRMQPQDPDAYAGLGEAELATNNYRTALAHFQTVLRLRPGDANARQNVEICNQVLALDPTARGLSMEAQYQRSWTLLDRVIADIHQCASTLQGGGQTLVDSAAAALKRQVRPAERGAAYESNLELAGKLWQVRKMECKASAAPSEEPVSIILNKLAQ